MIENDRLPGPGQYELHDHFKAAIGQWKPRCFSISSKLISSYNEKADIPGPSSYSISEHVYKKVGGHTFGKAEKDALGRIPEENLEFKNDQSDELQLTNRKKSFEQKSFKRKGGDIGKAPRLKAIQLTTPGPDSYDPLMNLITKNAPKVSIGTNRLVRRLKPIIEFEQKHPIELDIKYQSVEKNIKARKFAKARKMVSNQINCVKNGVNQQYNICVEIGKKGFSFGNELKAILKNQESSELGPGFYELKQTLPQIQPWIKLR